MEFSDDEVEIKPVVTKITYDNHEENKDHSIDDDLIVDCEFLNNKKLKSLLDYYNSYYDKINILFEPGGITFLQKLGTDERVISNVTIKSDRIFRYKFKNSESIKNLKIVVDPFLFVLALKKFRVADPVHFKYYKGDNHFIISTGTEDSEKEVKISKFKYNKKISELLDDDVKFDNSINIKSESFIELPTILSSSKETSTNKFLVQFQGIGDNTSVNFVSKSKVNQKNNSEKKKNINKKFGKFNTRSKVNATFKLKLDMVKSLSHFSKGSERSFVTLSYNDKMFKISTIADYISSDLYILQ